MLRHALDSPCAKRWQRVLPCASHTSHICPRQISTKSAKLSALAEPASERPPVTTILPGDVEPAAPTTTDEPLKKTKSSKGNDRDDIVSFLRHVDKESLLTDSSSFRGTLYEYTTMEVLAHQLSLKEAVRCGGAYDNGIDLLGYWQKQKRRRGRGKFTRISVMVQCKNTSSAIRAKPIRELIGTYDYHVRGTNNEANTIMVLAASSPLTSQALSQFSGSSVPMVICGIAQYKPLSNEDQTIGHPEEIKNAYLLKSVVCNSKAQEVLKSFGLAFKETQKAVNGNWVTDYQLISLKQH